MEKPKNIKNKKRKWIVLAFLLIAVIVGYVTYRGDYLETLELGAQYLSIFGKPILPISNFWY